VPSDFSRISGALKIGFDRLRSALSSEKTKSEHWRGLLVEAVRVMEEVKPPPDCPFCDMYLCSTCYELCSVQAHLEPMLNTIKKELELVR
jgi:hypothetical protein